MLADYGYVGLLLIVAIAFTLIMPLLPMLLSLIGVAPKKPTPVKLSTYECGVETIGKTWVQFNFRYYVFALLFVVFDVLVVFLYPWAVNFKAFGPASLAAVLVLMIILATGYIYAWLKKALEWK